jgi:alcohol dehydrogenase class IV
VFDLAKSLGAPTALREIGMREEDLDRACDIALQTPYPNPRPLERAALRALLQDAYEGARPGRA